jgi:hypothetical protein
LIRQVQSPLELLNITVIQDLLGHRHIKSTADYARANIDTLLKEMGGKTMSQRMDGDRLTEPGRRGRSPTRNLQRALRHRP